MSENNTIISKKKKKRSEITRALGHMALKLDVCKAYDSGVELSRNGDKIYGISVDMD